MVNKYASIFTGLLLGLAGVIYITYPIWKGLL